MKILMKKNVEGRHLKGMIFKFSKNDLTCIYIYYVHILISILYSIICNYLLKLNYWVKIRSVDQNTFTYLAVII